MKKIGLMLQFWSGEIEQVESLILLMVKIELLKAQERSRHLILAIRHDVSDAEAAKMAGIASQAFIVRIIQSNRTDTGWPNGCNALWQSCMHKVAKIHEKLPFDGVLTFEADCCPMRPDWLEVLDFEWFSRRNEVRCVGSICNPENDQGVHLNGNAIFHAGIIIERKELAQSRGAWDWFHRRLLLALGQDTFAIDQEYGFKDQMGVDFVRARRRHGRIPALLHGVKNNSARDSVSSMMDSGEFEKQID